MVYDHCAALSLVFVSQHPFHSGLKGELKTFRFFLFLVGRQRYNASSNLEIILNRDCPSQTSIGKKVLMALTGLMLSGFIVGHLLGNLTIFAGRDLINSYAFHLEELKPLVWAARITLLILVIIHILTAICITIKNKKARPVNYAKKENQTTSAGARTMAITGTVILAFIIFHLMHFTWRITHPEISNSIDANGHRDVFKMVVLSFQQPLLAFGYIAALTLLFLHLSHGLWSLFQSLGLLGERTLPIAKKIACAASFVLYLAYVSIPLACFFGLVKI